MTSKLEQPTNAEILEAIKDIHNDLNVIKDDVNAIKDDVNILDSIFELVDKMWQRDVTNFRN